jgi:ribosomal protein L32E
MEPWVVSSVTFIFVELFRLRPSGLRRDVVVVGWKFLESLNPNPNSRRLGLRVGLRLRIRVVEVCDRLDDEVF